MGKPTNSTEVDGIKAPNISGNELRDKDAIYGTDQTGVIVYVTSVPTSLSTKTMLINEIGYYFFNGTNWKKFSYDSLHEIGDLKNSLKQSDHDGWILLDGRLVSSLSPSQQANVFTIISGSTLNLPDASNKIVVQGSPVGTISFASTILQNQLPNVTLGGSTSLHNGHTHTVDPVAVSTSSNGIHTHNHNANRNVTDNYYGLVRSATITGGGNFASFVSSPTTNGNDNRVDVYVNPKALSINSGGDHTHTIDIPSTTSSTSGAHGHILTTLSIKGDVTQQALTTDNLPRLNVNMFVYLGF